MLPCSVACERNKDPILNILRDVFANTKDVLEVGSGTGQHAVYFSKVLSHLTWHPSDLPQNHHGIFQRLQRERPDNVKDPIELDVCESPWPIRSVDAIFTANTLHIMSWDHVRCFFEGVGEVLSSPGTLCVYGPFRYHGEYTSLSNKQFDQTLQFQDPSSGIRDFEAVNELAMAQDLGLTQDYSMPANNQLLVWNKS